MVNWRQTLFNFKISLLDTKIINGKLDEVFKKLVSAAKINVPLRFVHRNVETGEYRY